MTYFHIAQDVPQPDGSVARSYMAPEGHWHPDWEGHGFKRRTCTHDAAQATLKACEAAGLNGCKAVPIK